MNWNDAFKIAEKYYNDHGNLLVPSGYSFDGFNLYSWISRQRRRYALSHSQFPIVEAGQIVQMDQKDQTVKAGQEDQRVKTVQEKQTVQTEQIKQAEQAEQTEIIEVAAQTGKTGQLSGRDQMTQRVQKTQNEKPLTEEQISALESIGMIWEPYDAKWERAFAVAQKYYREHGNLFVPKNYEEDGVNLSHWIWAQRRIVNGTKGATGRKLTEEQIRRLEGIGMVWAPKSKGFSYYYALAKKFYDAYGHTDFPEGEVSVGGEILPESGETLAAWKKEQEMGDFFEKNSGKAWERQRLLCEIGIDPAKKLTLWDKKYLAAEQYYREHGDLLVPFSYITDDGIQLGKWISNQRIKRRGTWGKPPTEEQICKLDAIGMSWDETENRGRRNRHE